jgi:hypothetical protein
MKKTFTFLMLLLTFVCFNIQAAAPESGWYKIQNVGTGKYVSVKGKYYAKPDASVDNATIIYVGVGERVPGSFYEQYKLTSLKGDNIEVYSYLDKAVTLANAYVDNVMTQGNNPLTPEEVAYAHELIEQYKNDYGFLYIMNANGGTSVAETTWLLGVDIPEIPEEVEQAAIAHGVTDGVWNWAKRVVYRYIANNPNMDPTLKALVQAYIEQIEPGNTYYLTAEDNDTFGYVDALSTSPNLQWKLEAYTPEPGVSGYYRIKNAQGSYDRKYVNVTGKFEAQPNLTKEEALTEAGTIHYIGLGDRVGNLAQDVTRLSAQGRNVNTIAEHGIAKVKELGCQFVDKIVADDPSFADYADMAKAMINNYEINKSVNVLNTITSGGEDAYYCIYTTPSMDAITNAVALVFSMGRGQTWAHNHPYWFNFDENDVAVSLNEEAFLASAKDSIKAEVVLLGYADQYPELYQKLINNIDRIKPATTYYLTQDGDATFGYIEADELEAKGDAAKWILEPVDDENYFSINPNLQYVKDDGLPYYYTTLYTDFAYTIPEGVVAYKVTGIEARVKANGKTIYVCTKTELTGEVPAYTPVVIETTSQNVEDNKFIPTGTPVDRGVDVTPRVSEATSDNLLVGSFFDEENEGNNRELATSLIGFYDVADMIDGNEAYLDASKLTPDNANVYYLFDDEKTISAISTINNGKNITSIKYVNVAGVESDTPFNGMNIVVITFDDGTKSITKAINK